MKNKYSLLFLSSLLATFLFSCAQPDRTTTEEEHTKVRKEVEATLQQYHRDIEEKGMLAELDYLDASDEFSWYAPGYNGPIDYDSVVSVLKIMAPRFSKIDHTWDSLTVTPVSDMKAMYTGVITSIMVDTMGLADTIRLKETGTIIKNADGWKMLSGKTEVIE